MSEIKTPVKMDHIRHCYVQADGKDIRPSQIMTALNEHTDLKAQVAAVTEERDRYKEALEHYADETNWECPIEHDIDDHNSCQMLQYIPTTEETGHGYDIAIEALHPKQEEQDDGK